MQIELGENACIACTIISKSGDGSVHKGADPVQKDEALSCGEKKKRSRVKNTLCRLFTSSEDDCCYTIRTSFSERFCQKERLGLSPNNSCSAPAFRIAASSALLSC